MMSDDRYYDEWVSSRRSVKPSRELTDQVMAALEEGSVKLQREMNFADRMHGSRLVRSVACLSAMLVGSLPFLIVAYVSHLIVF